MSPVEEPSRATRARITAIVCTHNRADVLPGALRSLADQWLEDERWEILVVDNGSSDATRKVVLEQFSHLRNLHYLYEARLGLSHARNTGWRQARTPYVAYLDDDAIASPDWLRRILDAFDQLQPTPGAVGGRIEAIWEVARPRWFPDYCLPYLTVLDLSPKPERLAPGKFLVGTNMAFSRRRLESMGGFPVELGPVGSRFGSGEETMLQRRICEQGESLYYDPDILVHHRVPKSRLSRRWLLRRMFQEGESRAHQTLYTVSPNRRQHLRLVGTALRKATSSPRRLLALASPSDSPATFERKASACRRLGFLAAMVTTLGRSGDADGRSSHRG